MEDRKRKEKASIKIPLKVTIVKFACEFVNNI